MQIIKQYLQTICMYVRLYVCIWYPLCAYIGASVSHKCWSTHIYTFYIAAVAVLTDWLAYYNFINIHSRIYCIFFIFICSLSSFPRLFLYFLFAVLLFCCFRCQVQCQIIGENKSALHVLRISYGSVLPDYIGAPRLTNEDHITGKYLVFDNDEF